MSNAILDIHDKPKTGQWISLSLQHMFAMFGATILVPQLVGLSPAIALLTSGIATIIFVLITQFKVPAYLGSSFAFIVPIQIATETGGIGSAMIGAMFVSLVYAIVALVIWKTGYKWLMKLLPPIVVGPVIIVIGLALSGTAVDMAMNIPTADGGSEYSLLHFSAALVTLATAIICNIYFKNIISLMPILIGIIAGYVYSALIGIIDFSPVAAANWFQVPEFLVPGVDYSFQVTPTLLFVMVPIAIVTISEHIGHQLVLGKIVDRNYIKDPGLHRSILGDGIGTFISSLVGGPPKTTYGENIGVLAITKVFSVYVIIGAAVFAILFSFFGKLMAVIDTIPTAVLGGISILLFGIIASSGLRMLVDNGIDFGNNRNLVISSVILVIGIGGAKLEFSESFAIEGMALAAIVGVILNMILPGLDKQELDDGTE
ncbi:MULTISPECIES: solute carrier family 23 protein [unclassified Planococcus (in: firmicutes)]|uniref:solute carrier family 23 protein n=1 Tax=Planococcus TaxID=1372 RepID=UPI000C327E1A|nr:MULTISPECIES: solute carrier family 23 protein [unclassified Planococcus (in: firmicutes)]AUD14147.1 uracil permease [Planococcus sp. MB-3u-03]PKG48170.1 uracil permease [Planococcus sp. Urea-trap-24]PKG92018.1 uracil permease [Planococcus sp. Urea-3u-39]PKH43078.1 uracil permease [Planococcus sp. MB-3u-09]